MTVSFSLPEGLQDTLVREFGDLGQTARDAFIIEGYRRGRLSVGFVAQILGLPTSIQAQEWLARRGVPLNYDASDLEADRRALESAFRNAS